MNTQNFERDPITAATVRRHWPDILSLVAGRSKKAAAIVGESTVTGVYGTTLVLALKHSAHANMLSASPDVLVAALVEIFGGEWSIRVEIATTSQNPAGSATAVTTVHVHRADATRTEPVAAATIAIDLTQPAHDGHDFAATAQAMFNTDAKAIADALHAALPGGTLKALMAELLERQVCVPAAGAVAGRDDVAAGAGRLVVADRGWCRLRRRRLPRRRRRPDRHVRPAPTGRGPRLRQVGRSRARRRLHAT